MKHDCSCDCCVGVQASTPQPVHNRPALPDIAYRTGRYGQFRASMHAALATGNPKPLAALSTRDDEDLTIALLDATACMAEVLTFYNERLVTEAYLRTATDRLSLAELGRLIGYRLRPGVAAATFLAFHAEPPPPAVVDAATSPFRKVRMPPSVPIPAGTAVRSVPGPGEQQQTFETTQAIDARPEWNLMRPVTSKPPVLDEAKALYVAGIGTNLKVGDMLLFAGSSSWEVRTVATVTVERELDRTHVTWRNALTIKDSPLTVHVLRQHLNVFGYNAPMWRSMSAEFKKAYGAESALDWPDYTITEIGLEFPVIVDGIVLIDLDWQLTIDIDGSHPDIAVDGHVVLTAGDDQKHFRVEQLEELSRSEFAISGKVTRIKLTGDLADWALFRDKVRQTVIHAGDEQLTLADEPITSKVDGGQIVVAGNVAGLPPGRTLLVVGGGNVEKVVLYSATSLPRTATSSRKRWPGDGQASEDANTTLTFTGQLRQGYDRDTLAIFGNVVQATHGETVHQILGDGQAAKPFKRFELKHTPVTYVPSEDPSGASSTLQVRVNDVAWHEVPTLYQRTPGDRVFVTSDTPAGTLEVGTGDGIRGARVPTGQNNVRAVYRKGIGGGGNLAAGALTQLGSPPLGVTGVTNPDPARGGADPESAEHARCRVPLSTRTLGRAVSLTDYADFAQTFANIAKAHATVLVVQHVRTIVVTVAGENGTEVAEEVRGRLGTALRGHGDPLAAVLVVPHRPAHFSVTMKVRRHPDHQLDTVLDAVAARLGQAFGFGAREFLQPVQRSEVIAAAHSAPGVVAVDLDQLYRGSVLADHRRLLAAGPEAPATTPSPPQAGPHVVGAELLLLAPHPRAQLTEMP